MPFDAAPSTRLHTDCQYCPVQSCMGRQGCGEQTVAWGQMLAPRTAVMPGAGALCSAGDKLRALYSVRGGCLKAYSVDADGNERIRGFYLPGDLVGLDALGGGSYLSSVVAVVPSQVCVAPLGDLKRLMLQQPELAQRIMEQTSRELALALARSGDFSAEQRLAAFLLHMRERLGGGAVLRLPMAQRDIGNYLRLATETVCRTLKSFEKRGWLSQAERQLRLLNPHALAELAAAVGLGAEPAPMARAA